MAHRQLSNGSSDITISKRNNSSPNGKGPAVMNGNSGHNGHNRHNSGSDDHENSRGSSSGDSGALFHPMVKNGGGSSPHSKSSNHHDSRKKHLVAIRPSKSASAGLSMSLPSDTMTNGVGHFVSPIGPWQPKVRVTSGSLKYGKNSRRPRGRYGRGLPKKGGAGGKGTWGAPGSELVDVENAPETDDPHDPNYDSDSQDNCKFEAITPPLNEDEIEKHVSPLIAEYFEHGDSEEVIFSLEEMNLDENEYQILVIAVTMALDRKSSHREMTSVLISDFYGRVFSEEEIERGFEILLKSLSELVLDTPGAPTILGNFIARAVADDCVAPAFITRILESATYNTCPHVRSAMEHANALLNMKGGLVRLDSVWGVSGGMRPVKYLIRQIQLLLKEYIVSGELEEAVRCLQELEVPHFHHEFVYEAVLMAVEDVKTKNQDKLCPLLKSMCASAIVTIDQLKNGFNRIYEEMEDLILDVPMACQNLERFVQKCSSFLPLDLVINCPSRGRKRFVSEGDGGLVKN